MHRRIKIKFLLQCFDEQILQHRVEACDLGSLFFSFLSKLQHLYTDVDMDTGNGLTEFVSFSRQRALDKNIYTCANVSNTASPPIILSPLSFPQ